MRMRFTFDIDIGTHTSMGAIYIEDIVKKYLERLITFNRWPQINSVHVEPALEIDNEKDTKEAC